MTSFLYDVLIKLKEKHVDLTSLTYILPSKRAGTFLKHELSKVLNKTVFAPEIISIETFTEELSQLKPLSNTELLFQFYNTYLEITPENERESFESFSKWGQILLQDFNEIDRYLIPQEDLFNYLGNIQELNHWSRGDNQTELIKNYLKFWNNLYIYYSKFKEHLLLQGKGYQGLIYREAIENLETYLQNTNRTHIFLGFNALNKAEETIIQELLQNQLGEIYWDIDRHFYQKESHEVGYFARQYTTNWHAYKNKTLPFTWLTENYSTLKNIHVFGVSKNVGQAKQVGHILKSLQETNNNLESTAVVLADESLLNPVLNSIPDTVKHLNITMGFPLEHIPLANLFEQLFKVHINPKDSLYHKDVTGLLANPFIRSLYYGTTDWASKMLVEIEENNHTYLSPETLLTLSEENNNEVTLLLFKNWEDAETALKNCTTLIHFIKAKLEQNKSQHLLALEYLYRFNNLFKELSRLNSVYGHMQDISALHAVYKELLSSETLDFQGEPLQGLQIMGMLESRVLDFETVILTSVNEGILPSGKSNNSFIPFDVKLQYGLPTFKEKDAIYAYHFYRLIQRAKNIYIIYNTEVDAFNGGEKSRFITQMEVEAIHKLNPQLVVPKTPINDTRLRAIKKTPLLLDKLKEVAARGFSPSSLTNYMRNPIDFYNQTVLGISQYEEVEETVAANTLGTVVHNTLEDFYTPLVGKTLSVLDVENMKPLILETVSKHFKNEYKSGDITKGKNLIIFEIAKRYVQNFLDMEIETLKAGTSIEILGIELKNEVTISIEGLDFPVKLKGKVDRLDRYNGTLRVVDYKTGKVETSQVKVDDWELLTKDYNKYSKPFQVLMYAYMMSLENLVEPPLEAGIISFKNLNKGFLPFSENKNTLISHETLDNFSQQLHGLILEIFNPEIAFEEKEV